MLAGLAALGHETAPLLEELGLDTAALADPDARLPMAVGLRLFERAEAITGDDNIGLHLAQRAALSDVDVLYFALAASPTLGAALDRLCAYQRLINDRTIVDLRQEGGRAVLSHRLPGGLPAPRHAAEFIVAGWVRAGRTVTGTNWSPSEVRFAHPRPRDAADHEAFFAGPVRFGAAGNAVEFDAALLDLACVGADAALLALLDRHAADRLVALPSSASLTDRVRAAIDQQLAGGVPDARATAAAMRMSVRTLTRQLAAEGTSFRALLDHLRRERAERLLAGRDHAVAEVAFMLGFGELSSFHRAFRRWTGMTPAGFRQARQRRA